MKEKNVLNNIKPKWWSNLWLSHIWLAKWNTWQFDSFFSRWCKKRRKPQQKEDMKMFKVIENPQCRPMCYPDYWKTMVPVWPFVGGNTGWSSSPLAVTALCYCQLKTNVSRTTVTGIIILFTWCCKGQTVGNRCFLIDLSPHNNNKITTQQPCEWLQMTAISKRYATS